MGVGWSVGVVDSVRWSVSVLPTLMVVLCGCCRLCWVVCVGDPNQIVWVMPTQNFGLCWCCRVSFLVCVCVCARARVSPAKITVFIGVCVGVERLVC